MPWLSVSGPSGAAALARYTSQYADFMGEQNEPVDLINFGESVDFPLLFAVNVGVVPVEVVPAVPLVLLTVAVLAAANVLAVLPALRAAWSRPADALRAE